ncbi:MAG: putative ABC transporter permease [Oscillospiraceae bacterium]|jgi:uncharacterized membrane protein
MLQYTIQDLLLLFFIYAFCGWCCEVIYAVLRSGKFVNRGFLNGPVCPIYGFGVVTVIVLLTPLQEHLIALFLGSMLLTTVLEFLTGLVLERLFHLKWWDYSENRFNIKGYVCLEFSLIWGFAATFVMRIVHPIIYDLCNRLPDKVVLACLILFGLTLVVDLIATIAAIRNFNRRLHLLTALAEEINEFSDRLGDSISSRVIAVKQYSDEVIDRYDDVADMIREHRSEEKTLEEQHRAEEKALEEQHRAEEKALLKERLAEGRTRNEEKREEFRAKLKEHKFSDRRIMRAFPSMHSDSYQGAIDTLRDEHGIIPPEKQRNRIQD